MTRVRPTTDTDAAIHRHAAPAARTENSVDPSEAGTNRTTSDVNPAVSRTTAEHPHEAFRDLVQVLYRASEQAWHCAATDFQCMSLGHAIYVLQAQLGRWLPDDDDIPPAGHGDHTVVQLLRDAERRTRTLPPHLPETAAACELVIALCDLIRDAEHHAWH